jgi:heat shock protein HtpX
MFAMGKRFFFFMLVNIFMVVTLSIIASLLGVGSYFSNRGIDYSNLIAFCLVWGMGGAFISLAISRMMAKWTMGLRVLAPNDQDPNARQLVATVHRLAQGAGLTTMPEVAIYDSPELNAFATGPTKNRSLVAVSTGLLRNMTSEEVEGVLGHEVAHIANGDMVTMTLIQGVMNAFVMALARVIAFAISNGLRRGDDDRGSVIPSHFIVIILEMVLGIFAMMVVSWFSRYREFKADKGGATLAGRNAMVRALRRLEQGHDIVDPESQPAMASLKISGRGMMRLFSTHPPLRERIQRLEMLNDFS